MRLRAITCQVFTREMEDILRHCSHQVDLEIVTMGLHDLGASMTPRLQERIDAADTSGYDAIVLGYALCGRGTEGLHAGRTPLVLPRAHDCIGILMGSRQQHHSYFESHPGVYYRSRGWIEFQKPEQRLQPAWATERAKLGEQRTLEELIAQYGEDNGKYLFEQFTAYRRRYSGLTYISTCPHGEDASREQAREEARREGWFFEEVCGSRRLLEQLVNGPWGAEDFLVVPPGAKVRASFNHHILESQ
jgi:Protein of unknown function (DUF1638)